MVVVFVTGVINGSCSCLVVVSPKRPKLVTCSDSVARNIHIGENYRREASTSRPVSARSVQTALTVLGQAVISSLSKNT